MYRFYLLLTNIRKNKNLLIAAAAVAVFAFFMIIAFVQINKLNRNIETYESQIAYLNDKQAEYESAINQNDQLLVQISRLTERTQAQEYDYYALEVSYNALAAERDELERLNGDLLKKLDGLSRPN